MPGFIKNDPLSIIDPDVKKIIDLEAERQKRKLIFIPSESSAPAAVRESLGSVLQNIYAEGYPDEETRIWPEEKIVDTESQLIHFRRYSDPRYYKGVEFADTVEVLARRRCAELFANASIGADEIFVNVQALSGAPANNAVYQALIEPGDAVIGMNLFHGGHLTHGSSVNRSGKLYNVSHYSVDPKNEKIDYESLSAMVEEIRPKILIAGYSSYPWVPDWKKFAEIAHAVGAYFFADISHIAGLIAAGALPSPVGHADIITFTTHKTLCGPRGAVVLSFDKKISNAIDKAVFPGEQGGPHIQVFAGMATAFKLAKTDEFIAFQQQILKNSKALSDQIAKRGIRIAFGGTDTHLFNIDCKTIVGQDGTPLSGDMAVRILDIAGLVMNANTIPGDKSTVRASGVRVGTPWITQRGLNEKDMVTLGDIIADLLFATEPYTVAGKTRAITRAKVDFQILETTKIRVRELIDMTIDGQGEEQSGYPYFYYLDDFDQIPGDEWLTFELAGEEISSVLATTFTNDTEKLALDAPTPSGFIADGNKIRCYLTKIADSTFQITIQAKDAGLGITWLRDLSDGFIRFDQDPARKIPGPFAVKQIKKTFTPDKPVNTESITSSNKPYHIGIRDSGGSESKLKPFHWEDAVEQPLKRTALYETHADAGAKLIPFAGWEMPVWYSSVTDEHKATRTAAGLFDVSHMGVFEACGPSAQTFLDCVCGNDISALDIGESCYTHFLDQNANVIDDLLVYRHGVEDYLVVVNAANKDKDWQWLNAVRSGTILIDPSNPSAQCLGRDVSLQDLQASSSGKNQRVDIALQGPKSLQILLGLAFSKADKEKIGALDRTELCHANWKGQDLIISRTGYTGERVAFEIFIHPEKSAEFWNELITLGEPIGLKPCGLGARDSLRTEAGLPLYGHELAGEMEMGVGEAGFGSYIKTYKPWFIGRQAFINLEKERTRKVIRFQFENKRTRIAHYGDLVFNNRGKHIGYVTSCAIDTDEYLTGQALVDIKFSGRDETIFIYQNSKSIDPIDINQLADGGKISLPSEAIILTRFPKL
jgi:glycine hydroxymethyltransferase